MTINTECPYCGTHIEAYEIGGKGRAILPNGGYHECDAWLSARQQNHVGCWSCNKEVILSSVNHKYIRHNLDGTLHTCACE